MECIPKCTKMLQVNQPIRVQPEVKAEGGLGWAVQHCQTEMEIQYNMYKTCPIRCIRDCFSSTRDVSSDANPARPLRSSQVESMMQNKGVVQNATFNQMSCVCFSILDFKCSLYARMSLFHFVMAWFSHTQISWATYRKEMVIMVLATTALRCHFQPNVKLIYTCWISLKSWLTSITPPSNSLTASANASMVSISKWLVGSSRNSMWGFCQASQAKHTRHFWPSDKFLIGLTWKTFQV